MSENLGFLTVIDQSPSSLIGGYLVLNGSGRPLEFHCTMPLSTNRIQQILYGNTFQPFLYGERIAQTLIQRSKLPVFAVLTNRAAVLPAQPLVSTPIIYVFGESTNAEGNNVPQTREISEELSESLKNFGIDNARLQTRASCLDEMSAIPLVPGLDTGMWRETRIGNRLIAVPKTEDAAWESLVAEIKRRTQTIDLLEPFTRIRLALDEAKNAA